MPFIKADPTLEEQELMEFLDQHPDQKKKFEIEQQEFAFRMALAATRKAEHLTQKDLENASGLTQQSISRIEKNMEQSPMLNTILRYIDALGYQLTLTKRS
jgi:DNA-binding XRE family transcriptional regulator